LWMGVVAELIFFPAILAGPLGVVFKPRKLKTDANHDGTASQISLEASTSIVEPHEEERAVPAPAGKAALLNHLRQDNSHQRKR
jgi:hypothetical protein